MPTIKKYALIFLSMFFLQNFYSQSSYTFTPAGSTGSLGPTQTMVNNTYSSTSLNGLVTVSLGIQSWTVPSTGTYSMIACGAKGASGGAYSGGNGARMAGTFTLTAGSVIRIGVGQQGLGVSYNGGGGGGSFIVNSSNTPLLVAGGGGGLRTSSSQNGCDGVTTTSAVVGSGSSSWSSCLLSTATVGNGGLVSSYSYGAGGGGFNSNGATDIGTGGLSWFNGLTGGSGPACGGFGGGGSGLGGNGGGGGGGYSGGGGGFVAGGGGSFNSGTSQSNTAGANAGDGYVVIIRLAGVTITQSAPVTCYGSLSAALTATAFGGVAPYNYVWSTSATSNSISGVGAGTYTCTVTDAISTVYTSTYLVTQPSPLTSSVSSLSNVICNGGSNGFATVVGYGGTAPYTYTWSSPGSSLSTITGLSAGSYSVTIKDVNNCSTTQSITITQPSPLTIYAFASSPTVCSGNSTTLVATGALTYTWSGGVINGVGFNPVSSAVYTVNGTDFNGCAGSTTMAIAVNPIPTVAIAGSSVVCSGSSLSFTASGAISYSWNTSSTSSTTTITPITSTVVSATGVNSLGCTHTAVKSISVLSLPVITSTVSNPNICLGAPAVLYAGGAVTYTWSGGTTNGVAFYPVSTGTYVVAGTDVNGCVNTATQVVNIVPVPTLVISGNATICAGVSTSLTASGAVSYTWSTNAISTGISVSPSSTTVYSVTGINSGGCSGNAFYSVLVNAIPTLAVVSSNTLICSGSPISLLASGSANTFTWMPGNVTTSYLNITPSANATYTLTGASAAGCSTSTIVSLSVNSLPVLTISSPTSVCNGSSVTMNASGASTYTWSSGSSSSSAFVSPTSTTIYTLSGTGSNGCVASATNVIVVEQIPNLLVQSTSSSVCQGVTTGLLASGATSYTWLPGNTTGPLNTINLSSSTTYTVLGETSSGCSNSIVFPVTVNPNPILAISGASALCSGTTTSLTANGANTYTWSNGSQGTSITIASISNVTISVSGTDNVGCIGSGSLALAVAPLPTVSIAGSTAVCAGENASLTASGAMNYTWSNGSTNMNITVNPNSSTNYSVYGESANGCGASASYTLLVNPAPIIVITSLSDVICLGDTTKLYANGGSNYSWSNGVNASSIIVSPNINTTYTVTGLGSNGCSGTAVLTQSVSDCTGLNSIQNSGTSDLLIYPNPNNGNFSISGSGKLEIEILNTIGQVIRAYSFENAESNTIQLNDCANGVYIIRGIHNNKEFTKKLIIEH